MVVTLTGTHSIGKTTLMKKILTKYPYLIPVSEIARNAAKKKGFKLNIAHNKEFKSDELQKYLVNQHVKTLEKNAKTLEVYIEDRCLVDALAYTQLFYEIGQISRETHYSCFERIDWLDMYDLIIYMPLDVNKHKVVADGVRDTDTEYQIQIDRIIRDIVKARKHTYMCTNTDFNKRDEEIFKVITTYLKLHKD